MKELILLLFSCHIASPVMHFLKHVYTASSEVPNLPDFVAVVFVDGIQTDHYDSNTKITVPTQVWMERVTADDPEYWKKQTLYWEGQGQYGRVNIETLKERFNQTGGPLQASSWIKNCPEDPILGLQLGQTEPESGALAAQIKREAEGEDVGGSGPEVDPAVGVETSGDRLLADRSDTEDSGDYWREAAALWKPEETTEGQRSGNEVKRSTDLSRGPPPVFSCKVCGESFQRKSFLFIHTSAHLRDCGVCGKHLEHGQNLKLHLRGHRDTLFCCSVCGQSFTLRGNLRTHMRIHSGERPFGCSVCGKSFGRRATLVRHVRSHTGEKPFTCTYCDRAFVEKGNLTVHLRTHTGERPYWCPTCDRRFSQLSCFYKHPCQRRHLISTLVNPT